ncbi:hypothetical protein VC83_00333 [Pseudogymnoascus destructans]|uniref:Lysine decarboxylase-like protein n=2 Tax=Pseudogymnoascus destructans TaxID=655981 RepID=L8G9Q1_PSED2|nr:uncharacterized protein VC83_00333 [Pseudogymnoascus destructans]ELR08766.1 hypothetical protein GMDG_03444 [Pseudogymnoascus destructans 20631-21]OAF63138.1 hypothetical protein VC83_00333 [Pseudogymnoascus destructans]
MSPPSNMGPVETLDMFDNKGPFDAQLQTDLAFNEKIAAGIVAPQTEEIALDLKSAPTDDAPPRTICVFCGASSGNSPVFMEAARDLAREFHKQNIKLVYGGGTVGLMGEIARTLVSLSGPNSVHGIIPEPLVVFEQGPDSKAPSKNGGKHGVPDEATYGTTTIVEDMHTRKQMMAQAVMKGGPGSGFIALPGGYGTLEELMEVVTWNQLGIHGRGTIVLNIEGYWDGLLSWVDNSIGAGFVRESNRSIIVPAKTAQEAVEFLSDYKPADGRFKLAWKTL